MKKLNGHSPKFMIGCHIAELSDVQCLQLSLNIHLADADRRQAQVKIEEVQQELQEYIKTVQENEKRLAVLHSVTTAINQFSNLDSILSTAADKVMEAVNIDGVLIYLIDNDKNELELKQYRGISKEFSHQIDHLQAEEFLKGSMTISGQTKQGDDSSDDRILVAKIGKNEVIVSQFIVPLTAQE